MLHKMTLFKRKNEQLIKETSPLCSLFQMMNAGFWGYCLNHLPLQEVWLCVSHQILRGWHQLSLLMKIPHTTSVGNLTKQTEKQHKLRSVWQQRWRCSLSNQPPHHSGSREGPAVLVGDWPVDVALKEGEHGKPDASSSALLVGPGVGQSVVVQEESGGDVERYEHVNGVVFMCCQDEEDAKEVQDPGQCVNEVPTSRRVCLWNEKK